MALRKEIEKSLTREDNDVDAVEDQGMKDSVLAIASVDFKEDDVLALPLTSCKRNKIDIGADYPGKAVSREQYGRDVDLAESDSESEVVGHSLNDDLMGLEESESEDDEDVDSEEEDESEEEEESVHDDDDVKHVFFQSRSRLNNEKDDASPLEVFHSSATATEEVKRGNAVREQLRMWESLLECRIKLEPALVAANRLYQMGKMADFIKENKSSNGPDFDAVKTSLQVLSSSLLDLQLRLGKQSGMEGSHNREEAEEDDESIHSSEASDVERTDDVNPNDNKSSDDESDGVPPSKKKKISSDKSCDQLYSEFSNYRNSEINRWNEKAKVSGGRAAQKDFSAFDESIINIIESILFDKHRLVRKTQQNRSDCVVYGKTTTAAKPENDSNIEENGEDGATVSEGISRGKKHLYDAEIFDDGDFYQKLLRDFIETKSSDGGLSQQERKLMELHRLRIKMKRKLDTRATKGRKLRFVVHPKLVSFMAPVPSNSFSTEAEGQLLKSLFGQTITRTV